MGAISTPWTPFAQRAIQLRIAAASSTSRASHQPGSLFTVDEPRAPFIVAAWHCARRRGVAEKAPAAPLMETVFLVLTQRTPRCRKIREHH